MLVNDRFIGGIPNDCGILSAHSIINFPINFLVSTDIFSMCLLHPNLMNPIGSQNDPTDCLILPEDFPQSPGKCEDGSQALPDLLTSSHLSYLGLRSQSWLAKRHK